MRQPIAEIEYRLLKAGCPQQLIDRHLSATNKWRVEHPVRFRRKRWYDPYDTEPDQRAQSSVWGFAG